MFFRKQNKYDWANLALDWQRLQSNLSKRELERVADRTARFVCFVSFSSKNDAAIDNFFQAVQKSKSSELILKKWEKISKSRRGDWRVVRGAQICLDRVKNLESNG